jgi:bacterial/archaeal transporter family-2 protein
LPSGAALAVTLAALAGLAGSVQVAVMGRFGERIGVLAAFVFASLLGTAGGLALLLASERSLRSVADGLREPAWLWAGGLFGMFIVLTVTFTPPRIGTAATVALLIAGQLVMAAAIDRFGWFGQEAIPLAWPRVLGLVLLAAGAALALYRS